MSTSRRNGPGRGSSPGNSGPRRPRVAGHRKRAAPDSPAEPPENSQEPVGDVSTEGEPASPETGSPDGAGTGRDGSGVSESDASETQQERAEAEQAEIVQDSPGQAETGQAETGQAETGQAETAAAARPAPAGAGVGESPAASDAPADPGSHATTDDAASAEDEQSSPGKSLWGRARRPAVVVSLMLVLSVAFGGLAVWFHNEAYALRNEGPAANRALVDQAATSKVKGQVTGAVEKLFSYDYANTAKTENAAKKLLTGKAVEQYDKLFETVKKQAPKQKLVLTTTVRSAGVTRLQEDRAEVLLFVDQNATRVGSPDNGQNGIYPAQLTVAAEKHGDQWKISRITPR